MSEDYFMLDTKSSFYGFPAKGKEAAHKNCQKFTLVEKKKKCRGFLCCYCWKVESLRFFIEIGQIQYWSVGRFSSWYAVKKKILLKSLFQLEVLPLSCVESLKISNNNKRASALRFQAEQFWEGEDDRMRTLRYSFSTITQRLKTKRAERILKWKEGRAEGECLGLFW